MYLQTGSVSVPLVLFTLLIATPLLAGEGGEHRQHEAHVHGHATLTVAAEGGEIQVVLSSPAANIVGFEHAPANEAESSAARNARQALAQPQQLFRFPRAAACRTVYSDIQSGLFDTHLDEQKQDPGDHHDHHETHAFESPRHETTGNAAAHADIVAEYHFECAQPAKLKQLHVQLFETFPATQHLEVQYIVGDKQGAMELTPASPVLTF